MSSAHAKLRRLFRGLEALYQTETGLDPVSVMHRASDGVTRETLLLRETDDALEVGLVFADQTLEHLERRTVDYALSDAGLGDALPVLEGLSHLAYVVEAARCERPVSGLELETQAEVDKLAVVLLHRWTTAELRFEPLLDRLYYRFELLPNPTSLQRRYVTANRIALRFARGLAEHVRARRITELRQALRRFWHANMDGKRALAHAA